jgi:hypothetical protein
MDGLTMTRNESSRATSIAALLVVIGLFVLLWSLYPHEFIASDPWKYSANAYAVSQGTSLNHPENNPFTQRIGVFVPVALFYRLFGVSIITTNLWLLCSAILILIVVWAALPTTRRKVLGLVMCATSVPLFKAAVALYPDIVATAFMALSALCLFYRAKTMAGRGVYRLLPVLAVCSLFIAFLAKESAYWMVPLWLIASAADWRRGDRALLRRFYLPAVVTGVILGAGYLAFSQAVWGDPLARIRSVQIVAGNHLWLQSYATRLGLIRRLTIVPPGRLLLDYGAAGIFAFLSLWLIPRPLRFWAGYTIITVLLFWFGTTSFTNYEPLPAVTRQTLPCLPGIYILAGYFASRVRVPLTGSAATNRLIGGLACVVLAGIPFLGYVHSWPRDGYPEARAMAIVSQAAAADSQRRILLITSDARSPDALAFYFGYRYPANLTAVAVADLTAEQLRQADEAIIFVNQDRSEFLSVGYGWQDFDRRIAALALPPVYATGGVSLYRSDEPARLRPLLPAPATTGGSSSGY